MKNKYFKKLHEFYNKLNVRGFMCYYECFMGDFDGDVPFDDHIQSQFPVLNSTKYANINAISPEEAKALGELSQIPESFENHYNKKIEQILNLPLSKDMFKEHSLFLMKEHCKLFSPYNNKARELLDKLPAWTQKWGMKPYWMLFFVERQTKGYEVSGYELRKRVRVFVNLCKKHYGKTPIIYCSQPFYTKTFLGQFNDCQYWCGDVNAPVVLPHAIHQKTIKKVAGIKGKVDYNILNCKLKEIQL